MGYNCGGGVTTCAGACALAPSATSAQATCVANGLAGLGYPVYTNPSCSTVNTTSGCDSCLASMNVTDAHCTSIWSSCF